MRHSWEFVRVVSDGMGNTVAGYKCDICQKEVPVTLDSLPGYLNLHDVWDVENCKGKEQDTAPVLDLDDDINDTVLKLLENIIERLDRIEASK